MKSAIAVAKALVRRRRFGGGSRIELPDADYSVLDELTLGILAVLVFATALVVLWGLLCFLGAMLVGVEPGELIQNWFAAVRGH